MKTTNETFDVVVCGGGLAGLSAAIAAARHGSSTCLVQDRPVLGGNSSSEIRVTPHGAAAWHAYARETGILAEALTRERLVNHKIISEDGWTNSVWDMTLYDMVIRTAGLTLHESTTLEDVEQVDGRITAVTARGAEAETIYHVAGTIFIDCTGDGTLGELAGNESFMGTESYSEYEEPHAPREASPAVMGSTLCFEAKDVGHPVSFVPPDWAIEYNDPSFFYDQGRPFHHLKEWKSGYWWIELGTPLHTIHDNDTLRHELTRHVMGIWDYIKNKDPELRKQSENLALDWVGQVPGKRESRRLRGKYVLTENDLIAKTEFPDEVAYGGWFIDAHTLGGLLADSSEPLNIEGMNPNSEYGVKTYVGPYGIPLRSLIANDVPNLFMAGRDLSASHAALASTRVMGTCALLGQAVGTAAAVAVGHQADPETVDHDFIEEVQQDLLRDGCFLPNVSSTDPDDLARVARIRASSQELLGGVGPNTPSRLGGIDQWRDAPVLPANGVLERRCAQLIATGRTQHLDRIDLCLSNSSDAPRTVHVDLYTSDGIWDYRVESSSPLASTDLLVRPGGPQWLQWDLTNLDDKLLPVNGYVRVDASANPDIEWHVATDIQPGCMAMYEARRGYYRRFAGGATLSFRVDPVQDCYAPINVVSGITRPSQSTNLWRSDPMQPLPQWIELGWDEPTTIRQVQIIFEGGLLREYHAMPPFYRDPQTASDYELQVLAEGIWRTVAKARGNTQTRVVHDLPAIDTDHLRLVVQATNGDRSAGVYEIRCYAVPQCTTTSYGPKTQQ